jgi:hypothetical protein
MRNFMMIILIIGAVIVACLYLMRVHTVPADVKESLETGQGTSINRMTQVPAAVRKKLEQANRTADSSMGDAIRRAQDTDK